MDTAVAAQEPVESRRDQIAAMFDEVEANPDVVISDRARDESGRFASKAVEKPVDKVVDNTPKVEAQPAVTPVEEPKPEAPPSTITTWRKEYLPIQAKLEKGENLTPDEAKKLAAYNVEREKQYATGISTYKGEAAQAKQFTEALSEFMPLLQQHNIQPAQWIQNLGRAHAQLALGTPAQKIQMFDRLLTDYGIPREVFAQSAAGKPDQVVMGLLQKIQSLENNVSGITSWRQQQEEQLFAKEVSKFTDTTKYPYFEQVRESMIQLLESGVAQNPEEAYDTAVWKNKDIRAQELAKLTPAAPNPAVNRQAAVSKAKASGAQVRSSAPSGAALNAKAKDRRSALAEAFDSADNGRV